MDQRPENRILGPSFCDLISVFFQALRYHRTYLVNFDRVEKVSGNAQGYRLHFAGLSETVPVSRSLNEEVRRRLE